MNSGMFPNRFPAHATHILQWESHLDLEWIRQESLLLHCGRPPGGVTGAKWAAYSHVVRRAREKMESAETDSRIDSSFQAAFLAFGGVAFAAGFGASLAFSFAANSCLTLRLIASTSTL